MATAPTIAGLPGARGRSGAMWGGLVIALLVAVYAPTAQWLWGRWTMSVWHNAHGMFIPPLCVYFCWIELGRLKHVPAEASLLGLVFLLPGLALHALDTGMHTQLLSAASLVIVLPGLSLLLLGPTRTKAMAFPLAFLAFMLPIPLAITSQLHLVLRQISAAATSVLVPWLGIPVFAEGTTLHIADATLEVADACSGFSTLYAAMTVAFLTAYTCPSWPRRVLVLALAAPIAIAANIVRVTLLVFLVNWQGSDVLATSLHTLSGLLTFALSLPVIFWLGTPSRERPA